MGGKNLYIYIYFKALQVIGTQSGLKTTGLEQTKTFVTLITVINSKVNATMKNVLLASVLHGKSQLGPQHPDLGL